MNRRRLLLLALAGFGGTALSQLSSCQLKRRSPELPDLEPDLSQSSLPSLAAAKGIVYGGFHQRDYQEFPQDEIFIKHFLEEYALIVGGFFGVTVGPFGAGNYDFSQVEPFANFARQHQLPFRGHPLIWNEFNSPWLVEKFKSSDTTPGEIDRIFVEHISALTQQYAEQVMMWDVVNEVINVDDGRDDGLKDTTISGVRGEQYPTWLHYLGADYIERAFTLAHTFAPDAILVYNDNGLVYSNPFGNSYWEQRRTAVLKLLEQLKSKNTPVHALGIQSHLLAHHNQDFDGQKFRQFLSDVASMGLKIVISELDVTDNQLPQDIATRDRLVAEAYYEYLSVVLDEPAVSHIITWGLTDRYTWLSNFAPRDDGAAVRPLPLDQEYQRKPAWRAIARAFKEAPANIRSAIL